MAAQIFASNPKYPAVKLQSKGDSVKGFVLDAKFVQETDFATKEKKFWHTEKKRIVLGGSLTADDADKVRPITQLVMDIKRTDLPEGSELPDTVTLWAKGDMKNAIIAAAREAGESEIGTGGQVAVKFYDTEPSDKGNPKKLHKALYVGPGASE